MQQRVVIIGAGPGGLAAAILLRAAGARVTVLERLDEVGGRTRTFGADGFTFDTGPTFFLYPKVLAEVFGAARRRLEDEVELIRLDPQYHLVFEQGGDFRVTGNATRMQEEIARLAPDDAPHLPRFMDDNRRKLAAFHPVLSRPFNGFRDLLDPAMLKSLPYLRPTRSLDQDLRTYFKDHRVRLAFSFQSKYLGMSPFRCPSLFTILSFLEHEYGVFHVRGGCGEITLAMARVAREIGVEVRTGEPVEEVLFSGRRAVGVRTPSGEVGADALVVNADFAHAMTKLVPNRLRRRWRDEKLARKSYSCSTFMMYLGVEGRFDDLAHHTIWLAEDYERNLQEIEEGRVLPANPSFYMQNACVTDPDLAPPGHSALYVLVPVPHQTAHIGWARETERFRRLTLEQLERIGLHDLERRIRFEKITTPADWEHGMAIYRGATFNLAHSLNQMLHLRPRNRFEDLDGVYLVGGGTHPGSGLPVIFESARISSKLLIEDLGLRPVRAAVEPSFGAPSAAPVAGRAG